MRIALVAPFGLPAKGTARARTLPLGRALARRGHQVAVFIPPYDSPADAGRSWREGDVEVLNIPLPFPVRTDPVWHLQLGWALWRAVIAWQPAVIHAFKPKGPSGLAGAAAWTLRRRETTLVVDADDWEGPGGWNDDLRTGYSTLQRRFFTWQERYGLSHAHAWTVVSGCLHARAVAFGADAQRVFSLPNGVSERFLSVLAARPPLDAGWPGPRVLLYTRFAGVRVADVCEVWQAVRARVPEARLLVAGRGLAGEQDELARQAPGVELQGWVEPDDMPALFAGTAVAIAPWSDTPANQARHSAKVLELMAAGLPVVAYRVGELPVTLGEGGVCVPPADPAAFADAVAGLLADPLRARRLGEAAQQRVQRVYTWDQLAEAALAAYRAGRAARLAARRSEA